MRRSSIFSAAAIFLFTCFTLLAQIPSEQVQVEPPPQRHGAPPDEVDLLEDHRRLFYVEKPDGSSASRPSRVRPSPL